MALSQSVPPVVHVEVCLHPSSTATQEEVRPHVLEFLKAVKTLFGQTTFRDFEAPFLRTHVAFIAIDDVQVPGAEQESFDLASAGRIHTHVYQLNAEGMAEEMDEENSIVTCQQWILPAVEFQGVWESLIYDENIKSQLLNYAASTLLFSDKSVDSNIISWNRVILLHGPPGTGKTSFCKALAQKLSIRLSHRFTHGQLVEINSHSLFSRWFSESGKLVMKMFQHIQSLVADENSLVFVLIDEVESLTAARTAAMSGSEPSDAIRVVNALLTQIDLIKRQKNVIILTTSNITGAIDLAFVDRADIKQYIGPPSLEARYAILKSCIDELSRVGILGVEDSIIDMRTLKLMRFPETDATRSSLRLLEIARLCEGFGGRTLRKLPFLAHALFLEGTAHASLEEFLTALARAATKEQEARTSISKMNPKVED